MFSAAELIDAVSGRGRSRHWLRTGPETPPGEFPLGWKLWFARIAEHLGTIRGATADAFIAILLERELRKPPRRADQLNRWQAFATLWRQQWTPPETEDRRVRWMAVILTLIVHLVLLMLLFWLASVRFLVASAPQGEDIVQVEYVGTGTPADQGGGQSKGALPEPPSAAAHTQSKTTPRPGRIANAPPPMVVTPPPATPVPQPVVQPAPAPPPPAQPLQVSEVPKPDNRFALPATTPRVVELPKPQIVVPALQVPIHDIELAKAPAPSPAPSTPLPQPVPTPAPSRPPAPVVIALPTPPAPVAPPQPAPVPVVVAAPKPSPSTQPVTAQASPAPAAKSAAAAATQPSAASAAQVSVAPSRGGAPAATSGTLPSQTSAGSGPATTPKPGAQPTPLRADDWGVSKINRPGGNTGIRPGLFNPDGSPRLAAGTAQPGGGFPPGSDHWSHDQFDRAGIWLKRPPNDFTPTRFEKVWVPNETLLEEWVRKNIRSVDIPIPGTSKKVHCVVSLLQLGGGCGITDPNMNDQEAEARPPPDIPFKPELQEDQSTLHKPTGP
jgi:hypothetical protein